MTGTDATGHRGIYEVTPNNGKVTRLAVPQTRPLQAIYLPDPNQLLVVAASDDGRTSATVYDRRNPGAC